MAVNEPNDVKADQPDNGARPSFAKPIDESLGIVGTGGGYSGQEYDALGQAAWRAEQERRNLPSNGGVAGSGIGAGGGQAGENFDADVPAGVKPGRDATPTDA